ncbi:GatB/YqeY domain-containing protein [Nakamurella sp.]|uniref:GatB/YqeY domain-containing protein n=1 Tax=Nakamurella sp. TaxID=1869182 RepID=UPI003B3B1EAA
MSELKNRLRADLTAAMKARDTLTTATLRLALAAVTNAEVAGTQARELSDAEVVAVLQKEVRKRGEAAEAFAGAGRAEQAATERAEAAVLSAYLPQALSDDEVAGLVAAAIEAVAADTGAPPTMRQMGLVIKDVQARAAGRADGSRIAAAVKLALAAGG